MTDANNSGDGCWRAPRLDLVDAPPIQRLHFQLPAMALHPLTALLIAASVVLVTAFVCFVERGQRKILVNYAKRQVGNKVYGGQSSHLPFKLNMAGVIPVIFASSILAFPATFAQMFQGRAFADALVTQLGVAKLVLGWPLYVAAVFVTYRVVTAASVSR